MKFMACVARRKTSVAGSTIGTQCPSAAGSDDGGGGRNSYPRMWMYHCTLNISRVPYLIIPVKIPTPTVDVPVYTVHTRGIIPTIPVTIPTQIMLQQPADKVRWVGLW